MSISAKELAQKLNISAATVSMVLNNKPGISDKTRKTVISAAKEYGFDFSRLEQKTSTTCTIQLVVYKKNDVVVTDTPFFAQLIEGIENGCRSENVSLKITYFYEGQTELNTDCDGILLLGTEMTKDDFELFNNLDIPVVVMDTYFNDLDYDFITINNERGINLAVNHLIQNDFTEIGYLHSSYDIVNFNERKREYINSLNSNNLKLNEQYIHLLSPTVDGAYNDMKNLIKQNCKIAKAYVADNDLIAIGAMKAFKELGLNIPQDVSVIGFDNMPICEIFEPPLTTIDVPKKDFGLIAVRRLLYRMNDKNCSAVKISLSPKLLIRSSVK